MSARAPLPSWSGSATDASRATADIDTWAALPALEKLANAFSATVPTLLGAERLEWLDAFAATHWDFRGGAERNLAPRVELPGGVEQLVGDFAVELGLAGPYPVRHGAYDTILMTGGMVRAGIVKPRFARELLHSGLAVRNVVFLGAFRPFAGDELELAPLLGVDGNNEFDSMVTGLELAFGPLGIPVVSGEETGWGNDGVRIMTWKLPDVTLRVIAAPSSDPDKRRANTADTYRFWAGTVREASEHSVLVVTTPIYVPYQGACAVEVLGIDHSLAVETVGISDTANDLGSHRQRFLAQNYLQELRAAIGAMRRLRARLILMQSSGSYDGNAHGARVKEKADDDE